MEPRFSRNIPALTEEECRLLRSKRILVVGCGGLGGHLIDLMTRLGVGWLRVVDGDVFDPSNLNRQLLCTLPLLETSKAYAAADRIRSIDPEVAVDAVADFLTVKNVHALISGCDIVLDALDNISSRRILAEACAKNGIPYVYGAIQGWVAQAAISMPGDGLLDVLFPKEIEIRDKSVLSFTPALCASMQAALCVKLLVGRPVETGTVFYFDLLNQEYETIPLV